MGKKIVKKLFTGVFIALTLSVSAFGDFGWSDSPPFNLNLLSIPAGGWANSNNFHLNLLWVNRGWEDSANFRICLKHGDFDVDCCVNLADLDIFVGHWLETGCGEPNWCSWADFNKSDSVNFVDFALLAENWLCDCKN